MEFTVYLTSTSSSEAYPDNTPNDFTVHLPRPCHLDGEWECGLVQIIFQERSEGGYYLCCDLVTESFASERMLPVLRRIRDKTWQFHNVIYVPLKQHDFETIRIYLGTWDFQPSRLVQPLHCTLHFRRRQ